VETRIAIRRIAAALAAAAVSAGAQAAEVKLKAAAFLPVKSIYVQQFLRFTDEVNKQCAGKVGISVVGPEAVASLEQWNALQAGRRHALWPAVTMPVRCRRATSSAWRATGRRQRLQRRWAMINQAAKAERLPDAADG
jgi:hypothetical protein